MQSNKKVLFVDDEANVLQSIKRSLRKQVELDTALGGEEALQMLRDNPNYAVIVSDMRMPGMNGVELLSTTRKEWPDTVRMMLTGNADQETAVNAVNHGDIFRFLNKPCDAPILLHAVRDGLRQHELITAERDLLENTLRGSINALAEVLSLTNPQIFGRTTRLKSLMTRLASATGQTDLWQLESAAMVSQLGCVTMAEDLVARRVAGHPLKTDEMEQYAAHAVAGAELLQSIPRMDQIAASVRYQEKNFDGSGYPVDDIAGEQIPMGARLLKVILDFDALQTSGASAAAAMKYLSEHQQNYDPAILSALESLLKDTSTGPPITVAIRDLTDSMVLAGDVRTNTDVLLVAKGQQATLSVRRHLQNFLDQGLVTDTIDVYKSAT